MLPLKARGIFMPVRFNLGDLLSSFISLRELFARVCAFKFEVIRIDFAIKFRNWYYKVLSVWYCSLF